MKATLLVEEQPNIGTFDPETGTRRVPVDRFPYQVVYFVFGTETPAGLEKGILDQVAGNVALQKDPLEFGEEMGFVVTELGL